MSPSSQSQTERSAVATAHLTTVETAYDPMAVHLVIQPNTTCVSLDAASLFIIALVIILGTHYLEQPLLDLCLIIIPITLLIRNDYQNFLILGPGGTPSTPAGYARLSWLRLFTIWDPLVPPKKKTACRPATGILAQKPLHYRAGPRPVVAGIAPQRQLNQHGSSECDRSIRRALRSIREKFPERFTTAVSCAEKNGLALFSLHPVNVHCQGEICHVHDSDRSFHMNLHPDDIKEVLEKGWGQRHPLARESWPAMPVASTFCMIYAPRDETDLRAICRIIEAAVWYTAGQKVDMPHILTPFSPAQASGDSSPRNEPRNSQFQVSPTNGSVLGTTPETDSLVSRGKRIA